MTWPASHVTHRCPRVYNIHDVWPEALHICLFIHIQLGLQGETSYPPGCVLGGSEGVRKGEGEGAREGVREGVREEGREWERKGRGERGRDGVREEGREWERKGGSERGRKGVREEGKEWERKGVSERGMEGVREWGSEEGMEGVRERTRERGKREGEWEKEGERDRVQMVYLHHPQRTTQLICQFRHGISLQQGWDSLSHSPKCNLLHQSCMAIITTHYRIA